VTRARNKPIFAGLEALLMASSAGCTYRWERCVFQWFRDVRARAPDMGQISILMAIAELIQRSANALWVAGAPWAVNPNLWRTHSMQLLLCFNMLLSIENITSFLYA
jgi:hypothetical protein